MDLSVLPPEIIICVLEHLPLADLVRAERTCRMIQAFCHCEIERRLLTGSSKDEWGVLIHLDQVIATPTRYDPKSKLMTYTITMPQPVEIKSMFDHPRQIHCSLLRRSSSANYQFLEDFKITVDKGISQGKTVAVAAKGTDLCQIQGALTRIESSSTSTTHDKKQLIAPRPLTYALEVTEMQLPLSTIAAC